MADIKCELRDLGWHAEPDGNPNPNRGRVYRALARLRDELREPGVSDDVSGGPPSATTAGGNLTVYPSYRAYMEQRVLPLREMNPTWLRLDGARTGGNRTPARPLEIALRGLDEDESADPFQVEPTRSGASMVLRDDLRASYDSRYKHLYIYDAGPARVSTRADRPSKPNWSIAPGSLTTREELRRAFGVNPTGELVLASRRGSKRRLFGSSCRSSSRFASRERKAVNRLSSRTS